MRWKNNRWQGPAKVLMVDVPSILWLSHLTRLIRCAPEHVRALSTREYGSLKSQDQSDKDDLRPGAGVFQYHQLTETPNSATLSSSSAPARPSDPEGIVIPSAPHSSGPSIETNLEPGDVHMPDTTGIPNSVHSELQPDAEPENAPSVPSQAVSVGNPDELIDPSNVPIPIEEGDELVAQDQVEDFWEAREHCLIRHHVKPRLQLFVPSNCFRCPWPLKDLGTRITQGKYRDGNVLDMKDQWFNRIEAHRSMPEIWTGKTIFLKDLRTPPDDGPVQQQAEQTCHVEAENEQFCFKVKSPSVPKNFNSVVPNNMQIK